MAGKSESEAAYLRLPVHYGVIRGLVYMPEVDAIIVSTVEGSFMVYDAVSFKRLFEQSMCTFCWDKHGSVCTIRTDASLLDPGMCSAEIDEGSLSCLYHCHSGRLVVTNGVRLGARSARGGLVYLPTILQTTVSPEEEVVLEVPHEEVGKEALHDMVVPSTAAVLPPQAVGLLDCLRATTELGRWTPVKDSDKDQLLASLEPTCLDRSARQALCDVKPEVRIHSSSSHARTQTVPTLSIHFTLSLSLPVEVCCHLWQSFSTASCADSQYPSRQGVSAPSLPGVASSSAGLGPGGRWGEDLSN